MTSWLKPKTEKRDSRIHGRGLYAVEDISAGEIVAVKGGAIVDAAGLAAIRGVLLPIRCGSLPRDGGPVKPGSKDTT